MISVKDIQDARDRIREAVMRTPCPRSQTLGTLCGCDLYVKMENLQMTGSFKERGSLNKLLLLDDRERAEGVIASSAGNHALGLAYHAQRLGIPATIVMPKRAPLIKVEYTRRYGAEVVLAGDNYDEAYAEALRLQRQKGLAFVHPFDDEAVIAGQGTMGLEILEQVPDVEAILVPVGGGGLIAGTALAVKSLRPRCKVFGVEASAAASMGEALDAGQPKEVATRATTADGIAVKRVGDKTFPLVAEYVDRVVAVDEEEIANAILLLLEIEKTVSEGAGAASFAGALFRKCDVKGKRTVCVVSGGNIDVNILARIIDKGLVKDGRLARFSVVLKDVPGVLGDLTQMLGRMGANIMEIRHERDAADIQLSEARVYFEIETKGASHLADIKDRLEAEGWESYPG